MKNSRLLLAAATLAAASAQAADFNWSTGTNGDATGAWSGSAFNGQVYDGTSNLTIDGSATKTITTSGTITTPNSLTVSSAGSSVLLANAGTAGTGTITISGTAIGGTLTKSGSADLVLSSANSFGAASISSGKIFLNNQDGLGTTGSLTVNTGTATKASFSGTSYGTAAGTNSSSQFFLDTTAATGALNIQKNIDFGSPGAATTYAMVMNAANGANTLSGKLTGGSNINLWLDQSASSSAASALWVLSGDNSGFAGAIRVNRGRIQFNTAASLGTGSVFIQTNGTDGATTGSNLVFGFGGTVSNAITLRAGGGTAVSLDTGANNITLSGTFTADNTSAVIFNKRGAGSLTLTNAINSFTESTTIAEGTLSIGGAGRLNSGAYASAIDITTATSVFDYASSAAQTLSGNITGLGKLTKSGTGALTLSGTNTYSGGTVISNGAVIANTSSALGIGAVTANFSYGTSYVNAGSAFLAAGVSGLTIANDISVSSTAGYYAVKQLAAAGSTLTLSGVIGGGGSGVVLQIDTGNPGDSTSSVTLSGNNTFAGQIRLNRGTLTLTNANAAGTADIFVQTNGNAAGNLVFSNSFTLANKIVFGATAGNVIGTGANNVTLSGVISSGASSWAKAGSGALTLKGTNTFGGTLNVNAGSVITGNTAALGVASVSVASGATLQVGDATVNTVTLGSAATLAIANGASLKLGAFNLASLDVTAGTNGVITLAGGGTFTFNGSGILDLGGVLNNLTAGSHTYNLITGGTGTDSVTFTGFDSSVTGLSMTGGTLSFTAVPEPSTYGLLGAGTLAAVAFVRRRRSASK